MTNIIFGSTTHCRVKPKKHEFKYPLYMLEVDIEQLNASKKNFLFGYNKNALFSIFDQDYLNNSNESIQNKVAKINNQFNFHSKISRTKMVTIPRLIFKTFRPVSFYLCYDYHDELLGMFAEVTNTYNESVFYKLEYNGDSSRMVINKDFHVSPFFEEKGQYEFKIINNAKIFEAHINYKCDDDQVFYANFIGSKKKLSSWQALRVFLWFPFTLLLVFPRILYQAFCLSFIKKIKHFSKPRMKSKSILRHMPLSFFQKKILSKITHICNDLKNGQLILRLTDSTEFRLGDSNSNKHACINVINANFFNTIQSSGEIGLGESYMKEQWDSDQLEQVIMFMIKNKQQLESKFKGAFLVNCFNIYKHFQRRNTTKNSKKNIQDHYDLGNKFYELFLDKSMMYSSGLFLADTDTLFQAQEQKVNRLINGLDLSKNDHVLEIGSGWGFNAVQMAKKYQCKITSITLSHEQCQYAKQLAEKCDVSHLVDFQIKDYRHIKGAFDAIISIEMIEAVGSKYLKTYFDVCNNRLKPGGKFALQVITYPNKYYNKYKNGTDFIRKHIFPGGHLPSLGIINEIITKNTDLIQYDSLNIATSYAKTLAMWRSTFEKEKHHILEQGFNELFYRKWVYYFAYCEAAFASDYLGCYQIHYQKKEIS
tara:strand:- start:3647 stop:5596 length:1950 start_codon:yes stop_codon:yes gene_type:complete